MEWWFGFLWLDDDDDDFDDWGIEGLTSRRACARIIKGG